MNQQFEKHVVIPDLHGEHQLLERVVDTYHDDTDVGFVLLGDIVDRKIPEPDSEQGVRRTLEVVKGLGERAVLVWGNHEWSMCGAAYDTDPAVRSAFTEGWLFVFPPSKHSVEHNTLSAYDVDKRGDGAMNVFRDALAREGHEELLLGASIYYETGKFIALHAGIHPFEPWEEQRELLDIAQVRVGKQSFWPIPEHVNSFDFAATAAPLKSTDKVVVSGHTHQPGMANWKEDLSAPGWTRMRSPERSLHDGRRIRLGSEVNGFHPLKDPSQPHNEPLFVYEDWTGDIREFQQ